MSQAKKAQYLTYNADFNKVWVVYQQSLWPEQEVRQINMRVSSWGYFNFPPVQKSHGFWEISNNQFCATVYSLSGNLLRCWKLCMKPNRKQQVSLNLSSTQRLRTTRVLWSERPDEVGSTNHWTLKQNTGWNWACRNLCFQFGLTFDETFIKAFKLLINHMAKELLWILSKSS